MRASPGLAAAHLLLLVLLLLAGCENQPAGSKPPPEKPPTNKPEVLRLTSITGGRSYTCGLNPEGQAYCWGTTTGSAKPTVLPQPSGVKFSAIEAGYDNTCALTTAGQVYCWTATAPATMVSVPQPAGVTFASVAAGGGACALTTTGEAYCWDMYEGVITGFGMIAQPDGAKFRSLTDGGAHACGLTSSGQAYCWGSNRFLQLGRTTHIGTFNAASGQVVQPAGVAFASLTSGGDFTCGLTAAGQAYCWGDNLFFGLGNGTTRGLSTPTAISPPNGAAFASISAETSHICGLTAAGQAYCWGRNSDGEGGTGTTAGLTVPTAVSQPSGVTFVSITAALSHTCARTGSGTVYCWGRNLEGQLGDGTFTHRLVPTPVVGT